MTFNFGVDEKIQSHARQNGDRIAFAFGDEKVTYQGLYEFIQQFEKDSLDAGLAKKAPTVVYLSDALMQANVLSALLFLNIPALVMAETTKAHEIVRLCKDYPFSGIITDHKSSPKIKEGLLEAKETESEQFTFFSFPKPVEVDFSWLLHTSGSTGKPKIVMLSSKNLQERTLGEIELFKIKESAELLNVLPFAHDLGLNQLLTTLWTGSTLDIFRKKFPVDLVNKMAEKSFDGMTGMPQVWTQFIQIAEKMGVHPAPIGYLTISGGSLSEHYLERLKRLFPETILYKTYGQSETFRTLAEFRQDIVTSDICGKSVQGVSYFLLTDEKTVATVGQEGQLIHVGACAMSGYWRDSSGSEEKIKSVEGLVSFNLPAKEGIWTGDYFLQCSDGEIRFVGRKDDMVKHLGRRFFLKEVELCLMNSGLVSEVCVLQKHYDDKSIEQESLIAFVIPYEDSEEISMKLKKYASLHLDPLKIPKTFISISSFPLTDTQKIDRKKLLLLSGEN